MRDFIARVDDALIDRVFQPFVDWIGDLMAFGTCRMARVCVDLASLAWILAETGGLAGAIAANEFGLAAFRGVMVVMALWALSILRNIFPKADVSGEGRATANPLRVGMHSHRATCLLWMAGLLIKAAVAPTGFESLALLAMGSFATASVYIGACTDSPTRRREKLWNARGWRLAFRAAGARN